MPHHNWLPAVWVGIKLSISISRQICLCCHQINTKTWDHQKMACHRAVITAAVKQATAVIGGNVPKGVEEWAATGADARSQRGTRLLAVVRLTPSAGGAQGGHAAWDQRSVAHRLRKGNGIDGARVRAISLFAVVAVTGTIRRGGAGVAGDGVAALVVVANVRRSVNSVVVRRVGVSASHCWRAWLARFRQGSSTWLVTARWFTFQYCLVGTGSVSLRTPGRGSSLLRGVSQITVNVLGDDGGNSKRRPGSINGSFLVRFGGTAQIAAGMFLKWK